MQNTEIETTRRSGISESQEDCSSENLNRLITLEARITAALNRNQTKARQDPADGLLSCILLCFFLSGFFMLVVANMECPIETDDDRADPAYNQGRRLSLGNITNATNTTDISNTDDDDCYRAHLIHTGLTLLTIALVGIALMCLTRLLSCLPQLCICRTYRGIDKEEMLTLCELFDIEVPSRLINPPSGYPNLDTEYHQLQRAISEKIKSLRADIERPVDRNNITLFSTEGHNLRGEPSENSIATEEKENDLEAPLLTS